MSHAFQFSKFLTSGRFSGVKYFIVKDATVWDFKIWPLATSMGDCVNKVFSLENVWPFCQAKSFYMIVTITAIAEKKSSAIIWKPLSSDRSDNDR